jgi:putative tricarboxylic transport membrane protein
MGHTLLTFNNGDLQPLVQNEGGKLDDLTPIAVMATDGQILLVRRDSKFQTHTDFINALKAGERIIMTGSRGDDQSVHEAIVREVGGNLEYLTNDSTAVALTQILGGNADVVIAKPAASFELVSSGELRPLIAATKNRFNAPFEAPTFKELGYDIELTVFRGLAGPANMPAEAVAYWSDIMRQVSESPLWKANYLDKFLLNGFYLPAEEAIGYMRDFEVLYTR